MENTIHCCLDKMIAIITELQNLGISYRVEQEDDGFIIYISQY